MIDCIPLVPISRWYQFVWLTIIASSIPLHTLIYQRFEGHMIYDSSINIYHSYLCLSRSMQSSQWFAADLLILFCLSSFCLLSTQCCHCLWMVYSWSAVRFSLMHIFCSMIYLKYCWYSRYIYAWNLLFLNNDGHFFFNLFSMTFF